MKFKTLHFLSTALLSLIFLCSSCIKSDEKKAFQTLHKKNPWLIKKIKITKVDGEFQDSPVLWDTTIYDQGKIVFEKHKYDDFSCMITFNSGKQLKVNNSIGGKLDKNGLFLNFNHPLNGSGFQPGYGSGYLSDKKGDKLKIMGKPHYWTLSQSPTPHYPFCTSITEPAYYKCDWELEAN